MSAFQIKLLLFFIVLPFYALAQQTASPASEASDEPISISTKFLASISSKSRKLENKIDHNTRKTLEKWQRKERRIAHKLAKKDSVKAKEMLAVGEQQYNVIKENLARQTDLREYIPTLDSLSTSIKFLQQFPSVISSDGKVPQQLQQAKANLAALQSHIQGAEDVTQFLKQRRQFLKDQLANLGFTRELKRFNKQLYYYNQQVNDYKFLLKDHKKAEKKALELLSKTKLFTDFMRKNSMLASLFRLPGDPNDPASQQVSLAGLQTRSQVTGLIRQ